MSYSGVPPVPTTTVDYSPVTFESVASLTGCTMADGRGLLMWFSGNSVRWAVLNSPADWLQSNVVASASTAITVTGQAGGVACFSVNGLPYFTVSHCSDTVGKVEVYAANSDTNPTAWSLHGTVQSDADNRSAGTHSTFGTGQRTAGIPYVVGSNWVLGTAVWGGGGAVDTKWAYGAVLTSGDSGVTWSLKLGPQFGTAGRFTDFISPHIGFDPATGDLYWMAGSSTSGSGAETSLWCRSTDSGLNWTTTGVGPSNFVTPYTGYRNDLYALIGHTGTPSTETLDDPAGNFFTRTGFGVHLTVTLNAHLCKGGRSLYLFADSTVQWARPPGGPTTGFIGFGTF